ncbi:type II secretion system protein [Colwellia sp. RE-S-Sl-9]
MIIYSRNPGFTLIELLVVMVILGLTSSLVAPDMFSIVKRAQAKTELEKIKAIAELSVERSFFSASTIDIIFKDNTVVFSQVNPLATEEINILREIESEFFIFEETHLVINNGRWIGSYNIKLVKSPENKLTTFALFEGNEPIKTVDVEYSESEDNTQ